MLLIKPGTLHSDIIRIHMDLVSSRWCLNQKKQSHCKQNTYNDVKTDCSVFLQIICHHQTKGNGHTNLIADPARTLNVQMDEVFLSIFSFVNRLITKETTKITINEPINVVITIPPSIYTLQKINKCANQHYANNDKPGYLIPPFFLFHDGKSQMFAQKKKQIHS